MRVLLVVLISAACAAAQTRVRAELVAQGGADTVWTAAMSPDGRFVVTAGHKSPAAQVWLTETGQQIGSLIGQQDSIECILFAPSGEEVLTASANGVVRFWSIATRRQLRRLEGADVVKAMHISSDGQRLVTFGWASSRVRVWDLPAAKVILDIPLPAMPPDIAHCADISPDGTRVIVCGQGGTAEIWDVAARRITGRIAPSGGGVAMVGFSRDGELVITGQSGGASIWDARNGRIQQMISMDGQAVDTAVFAPDRKHVVVRTMRGRWQIWDMAANKPSFPLGRGKEHMTGVYGTRWQPRDEPQFGITAVAFAEDGRMYLGGFAEGGWLYQGLEDRLVNRLRAKANPLESLSFSPDGNHLLAVDAAGPNEEDTIRGSQLWDLRSGALTQFTGCPSVPFRANAAVFTGAGAEVLAVANYPGLGVRTCRPLAANSERQSRRLAEEDANFLSFSGDGRRVATVTITREIAPRIYDLVSGRLVGGQSAGARGGTNGPFAVALNWDGSRAATVQGVAVRVWDVATGRTICQVEPGADRRQRELTVSATFSPDSSLLATVGNRIHIWDLSTCTHRARLPDDRNLFEVVTFSPDSRTLVTGGLSGTPAAWDPFTGRKLREFSNPGGGITTIAASPDGKWVAAAGDDGLIRLWDTASGRLVVSMVRFNDGSWATLDPQGRYDAADPSRVSGLHWVAGLDIVRFEQMKERFYTPDLLPRALGYLPGSLPAVDALTEIEPWPAVDIRLPGPGESTVQVTLHDRGGGIGTVVAKVNHRLVSLSPGEARGDGEVSVTLDLEAATLHPDGLNTIEVYAHGRSGLFAGPPILRNLPSVSTRAIIRPSLWAVVVGTSVFPFNQELNLRFADKDALAIAGALRLGASALFGTERVHVTTLAGGNTTDPTKAAIRRTFEKIAASASPDDVLVAYFAGHGIQGPAGRDPYYYLTSEARSRTHFDDPALLAETTISSAELRQWLTRRGMPLKEVVVLDTCKAGRAAVQLARLGTARDLSSDQRWAMELLKDATGSHILMGSSPDQSSYEHGDFGQGLLTYALLEGMRGEALEEGGRLQVRRWFDHAARRVPELAGSIREIQQPAVISPYGQTFPLGLFSSDTIARIRLAQPRLKLLAAQCLDERNQLDGLHLAPLVNAELRALVGGGTNRGGPVVYVESLELASAGALLPQVVYNASTGRFHLRLIRNDVVAAEHIIERQSEDVPTIARRAAGLLVQMSTSLAGRATSVARE